MRPDGKLARIEGAYTPSGACSTYEAGRDRGVEDTDMDIREWGSGDPEDCDGNGGSERMVPSWSAQYNGGVNGVRGTWRPDV